MNRVCAIFTLLMVINSVAHASIVQYINDNREYRLHDEWYYYDDPSLQVHTNDTIETPALPFQDWRGTTLLPASFSADIGAGADSWVDDAVNKVMTYQSYERFDISFRLFQPAEMSLYVAFFDFPNDSQFTFYKSGAILTNLSQGTSLNFQLPVGDYRVVAESSGLGKSYTNTGLYLSADFSAIPEPTTGSLLGAGACVSMLARKRRYSRYESQ